MDEKASEAGAFAKAVKATFPVVHDVEGKIWEKFDVLGIPANVIINRQGKVVYSHEGEGVKGLDAALAKAMSGK